MLGEGYIDDGLLAFEADLQLRLREHDVQVAALDVGGDGDGDVDVGDRLGPFVGERRLLGVFFRSGEGDVDMLGWWVWWIREGGGAWREGRSRKGSGMSIWSFKGTAYYGMAKLSTLL